MTRSHSRCALFALALGISAQAPTAGQSGAGPAAFSRPALTFVENRGQWPAAVHFAAGFGPASAWVLEGGVMVDLLELGGPGGGPGRGCAVQLEFAGEPGAAPQGESLRPGRHHYLIGSDPRGWSRDVAGFARVRFAGAWPGVDVVLREGQGLFEYDLEVAPGAQLGAARIEVRGASGLAIDAEGRLVVSTALGPLLQSAPRAWTFSSDGRREPVDCRFRLLGAAAFGFEAAQVGDEQALVVDPGLLWSAYLGDLDHDIARAVVVAENGEVICTGSTYSPIFPVTAGAYDFSWNGAFDAFVTRVSADGSTLVYSTYLGGSGTDNGTAVAVAPGGEVVIGGDTTSSDFPVTAGALDTTYNGVLDAFVARLDRSGSLLQRSTFLGTAATERLSDIALDGGERVLLCGSTGSASFPTTAGSYDTSFGGGASAAGDAFLTRLSADLSSLDFSTFLGAASDERAEALALGADGSITLAGWTTSSAFPTTAGVVGPAAAGGVGADGFVCRFEADGQALRWSTFLGGSAADEILDVELLSSLDCVVVGRTHSTDFPTGPLAAQPSSAGQEEGFVTRLSSDATQLVFSTYLGGSLDDQVRAVARFADDSFAVTGGSTSPDLAVLPWVYDKQLGGYPTSSAGDVFVFRYGKQGHLDYATYLGGLSDEIGLDVVADGHDGVFLCGETNSGDFPTPYGSFDSTYDYSTVPDGFLTHLDFARFPFSYGTPKINSLGGWASLVSSHFPSLAENNFQIWVGGAISYSYGVFFWSSQPGTLPLAGGELLMLPPWQRGPLVTFDIFGSSELQVPIQAAMVGTTRYYQVWYYDANDPFGIGLSGGLEVLFYP
jgi:hypothetical protein